MTDKTMLDILSKFADASDESKPLTEGKKSASSDAEMANILGKLQQLNESAEVVNEAHMPSKKHVIDMCKDGMSEKEMLEMHPEADKDKLKDLIKTCKEEMKDKKEEMDEASCSSKRKSAMKEAIEQIEDKLLKEYAEFKEAKQELDEEPNEGNEFSGALAQAKKDGKEEFEVDGKKYKVTAEAKKPYVKPFDASGVRVGKRGKIDTVHRDYYHVKMEKDNITKAERVLADDGESEMHIRMNAKRDNPGWKIVSVRKIDNTDDKQEKYSAQDRGRPRKIEVDEAAKPDYIDIDGDGDKKESMKKAAMDKKAKEKK